MLARVAILLAVLVVSFAINRLVLRASPWLPVIVALLVWTGMQVQPTLPTEMQIGLLTYGLLLLVMLILVPAGRRRWPVVGVSLLVFAILPLFLPSYENDFLSRMALFAVGAIGLNLLTGNSGQISLGHGALFAVGVYASAILVVKEGWPFLATIPIAGLAAALVGLALGVPSTRLSGPYLAIATLGLAISVPTFLKWNTLFALTGGVQGMRARNAQLPAIPDFLANLGRSLPDPSVKGLSLDEWRYYLCLAGLAILVLLAWNLMRSRTGRAFVALRDSEPAARVMGIKLPLYKTLAFTISAFFAGVGGAFFLLINQSIQPDAFGLDLSLGFLAMIVIGGLGSITGSIVGCAFIIWITLNKTHLPGPADIPILGPHFPVNFKQFQLYAPGVYYGLALILIMIFLPQGIAGAIYRLAGLPYREYLHLSRQPPRAVHQPSRPAAELQTRTPAGIPQEDAGRQ